MKRAQRRPLVIDPGGPPHAHRTLEMNNLSSNTDILPTTCHAEAPSVFVLHVLGQLQHLLVVQQEATGHPELCRRRPVPREGEKQAPSSAGCAAHVPTEVAGHRVSDGGGNQAGLLLALLAREVDDELGHVLHVPGLKLGPGVPRAPTPAEAAPQALEKTAADTAREGQADVGHPIGGQQLQDLRRVLVEGRRQPPRVQQHQPFGRPALGHCILEHEIDHLPTHSGSSHAL
mmetsp:Transcript_31274/g.90338  ORF Transcript_31274/g.90338 Transcript_31274/m.90338 type:complete len:231 (+) Transcript_31274:112-804(+)